MILKPGGGPRWLRKLGWTYVAYHALIAAVLFAASFQDVIPGYWRRTGFQLELLFVVLAYPPLLPGLIVCGGLHNHCTTLLGHMMQVGVFLAAVAWFVTGVWVLASVVIRRSR